MRSILLLLAIVLSGCSPSDQEGKVVHLSGKLFERTPIRESAGSADFFIELDDPVFVGGNKYKEVMISIESDPMRMYVASHNSKRIRARCLLRHGPSSSPNSVLCTTNMISALEP